VFSPEARHSILYGTAEAVLSSKGEGNSTADTLLAHAP